MCVGRKPYSKMSSYAIIQRAVMGIPPLRSSPRFWRKVPEPLWELFLECWNLNPSARPTTAAIANRLRTMALPDMEHRIIPSTAPITMLGAAPGLQGGAARGIMAMKEDSLGALFHNSEALVNVAPTFAGPS
jgi:hypothetical protein